MNLAKKINLISNKNFESRKTSMELLDKLSKVGFEVSEKYDYKAELNICVGGDGAFLRAVHKHKFPTIPFIGINTGHLGFFQEISPTKLDTFIMDYINNKYIKEKIFLVDAEILTKKKVYNLTAVNEFVVKATESRVIHLNLSIDNNHLEKFSGDGIIISTPVGSTAYNFSSGGSIIYPSLKTLQITPLSPISSKAYRSLPNSAVIPGDLTISIEPEKRYLNSVLIVTDGREFRYDDIINMNFQISSKEIYRLVFHKNYYWDNLKSKFL